MNALVPNCLVEVHPRVLLVYNRHLCSYDSARHSLQLI